MQGIPHEIQRNRSGSYRFGEFELSPAERILRRSGDAIPLQPKVFDALVLLVANAARLVRKEELTEALWPDTYVSAANLTNVVVALRKVLGRDAIQTVPKHGYRFRLAIEGLPDVTGETFSAFVRAKELTRERSLGSMTKARELYWLCVSRDPQFAEAWAWLGRCCRFLHKFGAESNVNLELAQSAFERALTIDPGLASAHRFYTQLEADTGQAKVAMVRLLQRATKAQSDAETFAGLVQVLRYCGLLDESLAAHRKAVTLDPTIVTSVPHTHFLVGEYEATIEGYSKRAGYYLDAAAWAALGDVDHAIELLQSRLSDSGLSPLFLGLMSSLWALLDGRRGEAVQVMRSIRVEHEPEAVFYLARHFGHLDMPEPAIGLLRLAKSEGYLCSRAVTQDPWLSSVRNHPPGKELLSDLRAAEKEAARAFRQAGGREALALV